MYITAKWLKEQNACHGEVRRFMKTFGYRVRITPKSIQQAIRIGMDLRWVSNKLAKNVPTVLWKAFHYMLITMNPSRDWYTLHAFNVEGYFLLEIAELLDNPEKYGGPHA